MSKSAARSLAENIPANDGIQDKWNQCLEIIKDEISRLSAVRKGALDVVWVKEAHMAAAARKTEGLKIYSPPPARQGRIFFNMKKPPFDNVKLRQAVAAAIDWNALVDNILFGFGMKTASVPPAAAPYALPQDEVNKMRFKNRNLALSKQLLKRKIGFRKRI